MADRESEEWAEKSKRIEVERMQAARALMEEKPERTNLAFLNPSNTKTKGWSRDPNVILASIERMGNRSLVFAICGVVLSILGRVGGMVASLNNLGLAGVAIDSLPSLIGFLGMGIGVIMAIIVISCEIIYKIKLGRKITAVMWTSIATIIVVGLYFVLSFVIVM